MKPKRRKYTEYTEEEFEKAWKEGLDRIPAAELIAFGLLVILGMAVGSKKEEDDRG